MKLSVIIPVYKSAKMLDSLMNELDKSLSQLKSVDKYDVIFINDFSPDNSWDLLKEFSKKYKYVKAINLMKNFGQHNAIMSGLKNSDSDIFILMDDDLQHSPINFNKFIESINQGNDVCYAKFTNNKYSMIKRFTSWLNNQTANMILDKPKNIVLTPFKSFSKIVKREIITYEGPYVYLDGIICNITQNISTVDIEHNERLIGSSSYSFKKLLSLWARHMTNFSIFPLRAASYAGLIITSSTFLYAIFITIRKFINADTAPFGWTSMSLLIIFVSGVQLLALGLIGEYVGRTFTKINKKPQFTIKEILNKNNE